MTVVCKEWSRENINQLENGEINLALGPIIGSGARFESIKFGAVSSSFIARNDHPLFTETSEAPPFSQFPVIRISGSTQYQHIYNTILPDNPVMLDQASMWLALDTLEYSDAVLIGPTRVMKLLSETEGYRCQLLEQVPEIDICMSWTAGLTNDLFYKWLIDKMIKIGKQIVS